MLAPSGSGGRGARRFATALEVVQGVLHGVELVVEVRERRVGRNRLVLVAPSVLHGDKRIVGSLKVFHLCVDQLLLRCGHSDSPEREWCVPDAMNLRTCCEDVKRGS